MSSPAVSIITPVFNAEKTLEACVRSILAQDNAHWEWLPTDDGSTDGSWALLEKLARSDARIKPLRRESNQGASRARNASIERAVGPYIAFLDADDLWMPTKLSEQLAFMETRRASLSFTGYRKVSPDGQEGAHYFAAPALVAYDDLLDGNPIACLTAVYDARICGKIYMDERFKARMDYICWLEITKRFGPAQGLDRDLARYRVSSTSLSGNKLRMAGLQWQVYRESQELGLAESLAHFGRYALQGFRKSRSF
jgi:teichuronic acid biosynthesis glycosyltransferase TuaG